MDEPSTFQVSFSHVQLFVDHLDKLSSYQQLQETLNTFYQHHASRSCDDNQFRNQAWEQLPGMGSSPTFVSHGRDIVKQFLAGLGFRITKVGPQRLLVTSKDPRGVQFILTARNTEPISSSSLFTEEKYDRFLRAHDGHLGIGVLGFAVNDLRVILKRYQEKHPKLIDSYQNIGHHVKVLEVYAYYRDNNKQQPDEGTILRFIENSSEDAFYEATGFEEVKSEFHQPTYPAYFDHWVSNVHSRTDFLDILHDTLGFTPKVDFNAGVVAAGEAQIESTVTGNTSLLQTTNPATALRDQSQVYLPINNALSAVGHVHGFLEQLGQGVQHIASRVESLVDFVQQANDHRLALGEGFVFLQIPRSYYGILTSRDLEMEGIIDADLAKKILDALRTENILSKDGAVDLTVDRARISAIIELSISGKESTTMLSEKKEILIERICQSRYRNLLSLLGSHVSEKTYLAIVRNQILVDIQGEDLLYQIFTSNILQKQPNDEAPFLEFIQRVCSERHDENDCPVAIKPGCGGFGIRNFLTLFLSIEVSKAMRAQSDAQAVSDTEAVEYYQAVVDCFTSQLNESDPILTAISNAMTEEGYCEEKINALHLEGGNDAEVEMWKKKGEEAEERKNAGNLALMECSARYNDQMKAIRQARSDSC
ncbi:hypothetical protein FisN_11Lh354 [Fistulifera solaris]|uniref:4-hydroxyphenylpyruvate dioxygenase n=1 Tax=Fistulifera solaris TaxID=1519565 RepID=A0A1Z5K0V4_FISSO|nr:hypothetical protein FisN_11Lh354 [Fistulifera solaris]|eukprot:GAX19789.1 hypothetical protein FisN_11Lh354 [Fistulifera solaris]